MKRLHLSLVTVLLVILAITSQTSAVNQIRVYVPAQNGLAAQQLRANEPGEIWVELTNDVEATFCLLPIEFSSPDGTLLPIISADQFEWWEYVHLPSVGGSDQDGTWPDTILITNALSLNSNPIPTGTRTIYKMIVTPGAIGTIHLTSPTYTGGMFPQDAVISNNSGEYPLSFVGPDIEIVFADCNRNDVPDDQDILNETSTDCNANGIPDECDISNGLAEDCNLNGVIDSCEIEEGLYYDRNGNFSIDSCELAVADNSIEIIVPAAQGRDAQEMWLGQPQEMIIRITTTEVLDVIQIPLAINSSDQSRLWEPMNNDNITPLIPSEQFAAMSAYTYTSASTWPDTTLVMVFTGGGTLPAGTYDLLKLEVTPTAMGTANFDDATFFNGVIQLDGIIFLHNDVTDTIRPLLYAPDIVISSSDCNDNQIADELDISTGYSLDCNLNQIPDECEADCNGNGIPDDCDITNLTSYDNNSNGVPDECESSSNGSKVRVFVPAQNGHAPQQLVVGQPEDIFIEITLDRADVLGIEMPLIVEKEGGGPLWNLLSLSDVTFLPASAPLSTTQLFRTVEEDGISSDSLLFVCIGGVPPPMGTANWIKFTVVPAEIGTLTFNASGYTGNAPYTLNFVSNDTTIYPSFEAEPITVIGERIGSGCCRDGYTGNVDCDVDARRNLADITRLIDHVYISKDPLCCDSEGNVNGDAEGAVNLADITRLIDHVYLTKEPTSVCF